ncbi:hypothetical protein ACWGQT_03860 [Streptomyces yangpuensis]
MAVALLGDAFFAAAAVLPAFLAVVFPLMGTGWTAAGPLRVAFASWIRSTPSPHKNPPRDPRPHSARRGGGLSPVWANGGIDTSDAVQRQAFKNLAAADMATRGDIIDRFHDNVLYSFQMLSEPSTPTDTHCAFPLT